MPALGTRKWQNCRSMMSFLKPRLLIITEKWLRDGVQDADIRLDGSTLLLQDRFQRRGGGISEFVKSALNSMYRALPAEAQLSLGFGVIICEQLTNQSTLPAFAADRSPNASIDDHDRLFTAMNFVYKHRGECLIIGDFNAPDMDWESLVSFFPNSFEAKLIDVVDDLILHQQHVLTPTRIRIDPKQSLWDLVLTTHPETLSGLRILPPLTKSDHALLHAKVWIHGRSIESAATPSLTFTALEDEVIKHYAGGFDWNSLMYLHTARLSLTWNIFLGISISTQSFVTRPSLWRTPMEITLPTLRLKLRQLQSASAKFTRGTRAGQLLIFTERPSPCARCLLSFGRTRWSAISKVVR